MPGSLGLRQSLNADPPPPAAEPPPPSQPCSWPPRTGQCGPEPLVAAPFPSSRDGLQGERTPVWVNELKLVSPQPLQEDLELEKGSADEKALCAAFPSHTCPGVGVCVGGMLGAAAPLQP